MKPRVLLINPWIYDFAAFNLWARPLGLLEVAEYLSSFDVELLFLDCLDSFKPGKYGAGKYRHELVPKPDVVKNVPRRYKRYGISVEEFRSRVKTLMPFDVALMTTIMSYWHPGAQEAISLIKKIAGGVPVALGGIYPTLYPLHAARNSGADRIYTGTVDDRLLSVLHDLGIYPDRVRAPVPYYKLDCYSTYPFAPLLTSTGCPFHCSYCASNLLSGEYARRPMEAVLREIRELTNRGVLDFAFYDDALLYGPKDHIGPLLQAVIDNGLAVRLHAPNALHARFIDDGLARLMRHAGFRTIRLGLETVDGARQIQTGGKVRNDELERAIAALRENRFAKADIGVYLMYGLPGQDLAEVEDGVRFLKSLNVGIHLVELSPIKGTEIWNELVLNGTILDDLDPLLTNNTVFSFLHSGYDRKRVERMKLDVKEWNAGDRAHTGVSPGAPADSPPR